MKKNIINTPVKDFSSVNTQSRIDLNIKAGDTVKVSVKIKEKNAKGKEKVRIQIFEGLVLSRKHGSEPGATITVRKQSKGVGVERIFPIFSPIIDKIEIVKKGNVRRSKLYYIREKVNREIRRQMRKAKLVFMSSLSDTEEQLKKENEAKKLEEEQLKKAEEDAKDAEKVEAEEVKEEEVAETEEKKD